MNTLVSQNVPVATTLTVSGVLMNTIVTISITGGTALVETLNGSDPTAISEGTVTNQTVELTNPAIRELRVTPQNADSYVTVTSRSV